MTVAQCLQGRILHQDSGPVFDISNLSCSIWSTGMAFIV